MLGKLTSLQKLDLCHCPNILQISHEVGSLKLLVHLNLSENTFYSLPDSLCQLQLRKLNLSGCTNLKSIPSLPPSIKKIKARDCICLVNLPPNMSQLQLLMKLELDNCLRLGSAGFMKCTGLKNLSSFRMRHCNVSQVSSEIRNLVSLQYLYLSGNIFSVLPDSFNNLSELVHFRIDDCSELHLLPVLPSNLDYIYAPWCPSLKVMTFDPMQNAYVLRSKAFKHQVYIKELSIDCPPILYKIVNHYLHFGHKEFCLVTGFRCGEGSELVNDKIHFLYRLFLDKDKNQRKNAKVKELWQIIDNEKLWRVLDDEDAVRMVFFAWNSFPWGEYMWTYFYKRTVNVVKNHAEKKYPKKMVTYNLNGFVWALKIVPFIQAVKPKVSDFQRYESEVVDYVHAEEEVFLRPQNVPVDVVQKQDGDVSSYFKGRFEPKIMDAVDLLCKQVIDVRPEMKGMVDELRTMVIDSLTTIVESVVENARVVQAEVVNGETNLVDCPVVENVVYDPKNLSYRDTQPSSLDHQINTCVNNDLDDYIDIEKEPSKYCLDNMTISIKEETGNGEFTVRRNVKMDFTLEDKEFVNENSDFDKLLKDGNMDLDKLIADLQMLKASKVNVIKEPPYMQQKSTTPQVKKKRKRCNNLESNEFPLPSSSVVDGAQDKLEPFIEIDLLWQFRAPNADWSIVGHHLCSSILSDQMPFYYANDKRYHVPWSM
ncbi:TMV resistance protein N [Tanacetum coccineum]